MAAAGKSTTKTPRHQEDIEDERFPKQPWCLGVLVVNPPEWLRGLAAIDEHWPA
jgi:hypothetical protein